MQRVGCRSVRLSLRNKALIWFKPYNMAVRIIAAKIYNRNFSVISSVFQEHEYENFSLSSCFKIYLQTRALKFLSIRNIFFEIFDTETCFDIFLQKRKRKLLSVQNIFLKFQIEDFLLLH